ncbi:MAG TPA: putative toxin-antitoxin system toxin component, PIN family [Hanamia sp.]
MRKDRFVLDNNIWISYLIAQTEQRLVDIINNNDLVIFSCEELFEELNRVLNYSHLKKFNVNIKYALKVVKNITVFYSITYPLKRYIPNDEADDYLIALALQTNSGFVASGDKHILSEKNNLEKKYKKLRILTKAEFEAKFV